MPEQAASFFELSLVLQIALGSGYLAYSTSYAGLRHDHNAADQISISLVFSAIALALANSLASLPDGVRVGLTLIFVLFIGILWRVIGRRFWHLFLRKLNIHREDGIHSGWAALVQTTRGVSQATVYTQDGLELHLADREPYKDLDWGGLYLCGDGSITMIVDSECTRGGPDTSREGIVDEDWGARYTHIPSGQISRVDLRMK